MKKIILLFVLLIGMVSCDKDEETSYREVQCTVVCMEEYKISEPDTWFSENTTCLVGFEGKIPNHISIIPEIQGIGEYNITSNYVVISTLSGGGASLTEYEEYTQLGLVNGKHKYRCYFAASNKEGVKYLIRVFFN